MGLKLRTSIIVVFALTVVKLMSVSGQGSCGASFNETKGEITTAGFPYRLSFNHTCYFIIEGGRVKLTFQNVSVPIGTVVLVDSESFIAGTTRKLQSRVLYTTGSRTAILLVVKTNDTIGFKGVRILYERISNELCHYSYRTNPKNEIIYSPRWPSNVNPNTTCEYRIGSFNGNQVVQISIAELSLLPGDYLTIYDEEDDKILARYNGTSKFIKSMTSNSTSVRVTFRSSDKPTSGRRRFSFIYRNVEKGSCLEEYYGESGQSSSVNKSCVFVIRVPNGRVLLRFDNLFIPSGDNVVVTQKYFRSSLEEEESYLIPSDSGHVKYIVAAWKRVEIEINFNSSTKFDFSFKDTKKDNRDKSDKCPYYVSASSIEYYIRSPGYPGNYSGPSTCEYFIKSAIDNQVVHVIFSELFLSPGDNLAIYDGSDGALLAMYDRTPGLLKSVTSNSASVRVVLRIKDLKPSAKRRFHLYYKTISKGSCVEEYFDKSGSFSSANKSCVVIIRVPYRAVELRFGSLFIPRNDRITVTKGPRTKFVLMPADSGRVKYIIINYARLLPIHVKFNSFAKFNLTFKEFKHRYSVKLQGSSGVLTSPYYPQTPHWPQTYLNDLFVTYHVHVPSGHVKLNFTDLTLSRGRWPYPDDSLTIYDGNNSSAHESARYTNRTINDLPHVIVSSKNVLTVEYSASPNVYSSGNSFRFKAVYTMETQVKYCTPLNYSNSYASRNLTLPGWKTTYECDKGYVNKDYPYTTQKSLERLCVYNGNWAPAKPLNCLLRCEPPSVSSNSSLEWLALGASKNLIHVGVNVKFYCLKWDEDMIGQNVITCTSFGNYSASPPICKKRPPKDKDDSGVKPWVYGAGLGGAVFIISIVLAVLRVCFGCCASRPLCSSADETIELGKLHNPEQI